MYFGCIFFTLSPDLKSKQNYTFSSGDNSLTTPKYDIAYFKNLISKDLPSAKLGAIKISKEQPVVSEVVSIWQQPWFMWLCIGFAALIIAYFDGSYKRFK